MRRLIKIFIAKIRIPKGLYCYKIKKMILDPYTIHIKCCPYWGKDYTKPNQMNGYCTYLNMNDWEDTGTMLLWDQVKECGINSCSLF